MEKTEQKEGTETTEILFFHGLTNDRREYKFTVAGACYSNKMNLGISICSDNDQFVKATGRRLATERLVKGVNNGMITIVANIKKGTERRIFNTFAATLQYIDRRDLIDLFNMHKEAEEE